LISRKDNLCQKTIRDKSDLLVSASPNDNSGSIQYNRFEFGGGSIFIPNQEVNGFTFCGVGDATVFSHNEVLNAGDDGIEFFGGTVNVDHVLLFGCIDDDVDFDEGYRGRLQFIIGYRTDAADISGSHNIEADNDAAGSAFGPLTSPFIANATFVGPGTSKNYVNTTTPYFAGALFLRRNVRIKLVNSLIIAQQHPFALVTTPSTRPLVASTYSLADSILLAFNIFQINSASPVVFTVTEGDPANTPTADGVTISKLISLGNEALVSFGDFQLDVFLNPQPGSPAASDGIDLSGFGFIGTTQRGALISSDPWTSQGTWISTALN
jgi:hypothetical protein